MSFEKGIFRESLLRQKPPHEKFLKDALIASYDEDDRDANEWLNQMFSQMQVIFKDPAQSPYLKLCTTRFAVQLLLLGDIKLCQQFQRKVYPYLKNVCQYDRHIRPERRGEQFFKHNSCKIEVYTAYINGNSQTKEEMRKMGIQYVQFCLQSIPVWASWLPNDLQGANRPSVYVRSYQALKSDGIIFPQQHEYSFYTKKNVQYMDNKAKQLIELVMEQLGQNDQSNVTSQLTDRGRQIRSDIRRPRQSIIKLQRFSDGRRDRSINLELRSNLTNGPGKGDPITPGFIQISNHTTNNLQTKQTVRIQLQTEKITNIKKGELQQRNRPRYEIKDDQSFNLSRIKQLEQREIELLRVIRQQKIIIDNKQHSISSSRELGELRKQLENALGDNRSLTAEVLKLRETITILNQECYNLRGQINLLQKQKINEYPPEVTMSSPKLSKRHQELNGSSSQQLEQLRGDIHRLQKQNRELKVNLLSECVESSEFNQSELKRRKASHIRFDHYSPDGLFQPYYSSLNTEEQVRFRRSLLKNKEVLAKDSIVEVGCLTEMLAVNRLKLSLFITNITQQPIRELQCSLFHSNEVILVKGNEKPLRTLLSNCQERLTYVFEFTREDFGSIVAAFKYVCLSESHKKHLLLPISKLKLVELKPYLPNPELNHLKERTVELDARVVQSLQRLAHYYELVYEKIQDGVSSYYLQFSYLRDNYEMCWRQIGQNVHITIKFSPHCAEQAEKLLDQQAFLLSQSSS